MELVERLGFGTLERLGREMSHLEFELWCARMTMSGDDWLSDDQIQQRDEERDQRRAERQSGRVFSEDEVRQHGHHN